MDASQFDAWTRRRLGLTAGVAAASLLGLLHLDETEAKNNKNKKNKKAKRCKKLGTGCNPKKKDKRKCCAVAGVGQPVCEAITGLGGKRCCFNQEGLACSSDSECCGDLRCVELRTEGNGVGFAKTCRLPA